MSKERLDELIAATKLGELINKKEEDKKCKKCTFYPRSRTSTGKDGKQHQNTPVYTAKYHSPQISFSFCCFSHINSSR